MQITAPDEIEIETLNVPVGDDWRRLPIITRGLGDEWLNSKRTALARVPSAIPPNTWNFLLNPEHHRACFPCQEIGSGTQTPGEGSAEYGRA
jgi:RES domain-containing protein